MTDRDQVRTYGSRVLYKSQIKKKINILNKIKIKSLSEHKTAPCTVNVRRSKNQNVTIAVNSGKSKSLKTKFGFVVRF